MTRLHVQVNPAAMLAGEITEARVRAGAAAFGDGLFANLHRFQAGESLMHQVFPARGY